MLAVVHHLSMGMALAFLVCWAALAQNLPADTPTDPTEIIRRSVDHDMINFEHLKNYTYAERDERRAYDKQGKLKKTEIETYEVLILGGRDYERLIGHDDKPLPEREARREQGKMDKELARREHESVADKAKREKERQEERRFLNEVPEAFTFHLVGEEAVSGKSAWVITADPRTDYKPKDRRARLITKLRGKIWIDKGEYQWVKVEAEAIGALSFGLGLVRIEPGAIVHFEQTRINDEVWLPAIARIYANARLAIFRQVHSELDMMFRDYRKFQTDSHLVTEESH